MTSPPPVIESLFAEARWVRTLATSLLLDPERADDAVQQTWVLTLEHPPRSDRNLRSWLAAVVRNVTRQSAREESRRARREQLAAPRESLASTEELVERADLQRRLVEEVLHLREPYRTTVLQRFFEDRSVREIAAHRGLPSRTVETHLRRALEQLRERLDGEYGNRRAWGSVLLPLAAAPGASITGVTGVLTAVLSGGLIVTTKLKIAAVAAMLIASCVTWWLVESGEPQRESTAQSQSSLHEIAAPAASTAEEKDRDAERLAAPQVEPTRVAVAEAQPEAIGIAREGSLLVRVCWTEDKTPAAGVWARLLRSDVPDPYFNDRRAMTQADGNCRFSHLSPGNITLYLDRNVSRRVRIEADKEVEIALEIPTGLTVDGLVIDKAGEKIAGADIWMSGLGGSADGEVVAQSSADGTFRLRSVVGGYSRINARAVGYAPSLQHWLMGSSGTMKETLVLEHEGGGVAGRVFDPDGKPVAGASVRLGKSNPQGFLQREDGSLVAETDTLTTKTDANGDYRFSGFLPGQTEIAARARGCAPSIGPVTVSLHVIVRADIYLEESGTISGTVKDGEDRPVAGAQIFSGEFADFLGSMARTDAQGFFTLGGLAPGEIDVRANADERGQAKARLRVESGEEVEWNPVLSTGLEIVGRVIDAHDLPLEGWSVSAEPIITNAVAGQAIPDYYWSMAKTDGSGRFALKNCRDCLHRVSVSAPKARSASVLRADVRPGRTETIFRITENDLATVYITGRVVDPDGKPCANVVYWAYREGIDGTGLETTDATGVLEIGPIPAGLCTVWFQAAGFPDVELQSGRALEPNETWKLGDVRLQIGGTILVRTRDAADHQGGDPTLEVIPRDRPRPLRLERLRLDGAIARSKPLIPGSYLLQVSGEHTARAAYPVEVRAGTENEIDVELEAGISRTLRFHGEGTESLRKLHVVLRDTNDSLVLVEDLTPFANAQDPSLLELMTVLAPGTYKIEATSDAGLTADATFSVPGEDGSDSVEMTLHAGR